MGDLWSDQQGLGQFGAGLARACGIVVDQQKPAAQHIVASARLRHAAIYLAPSATGPFLSFVQLLSIRVNIPFLHLPAKQRLSLRHA
jgi:hypothetical protein